MEIESFEVRQKVPFAMVPNVLCRDKNRKGIEKLIYLILASHANAQKEAWPSISTIAALAGASKTTVMKALEALSDSGWIEIKKVRIQESFRNIYTLNMILEGAVGEKTQKVRDTHPVKENFSTVPSETMENNHSTPGEIHSTPDPISTVSQSTGRIIKQEDEEKKMSCRSATASHNRSNKLKTDHSVRRKASGHFYTLYAKRRDRAKPRWGVVEEKLLDEDLQRAGLERVTGAMTVFMENPPPQVAKFCAEAGIEYRIFHSQLDKLLAAERDPATKHRAEMNEMDRLLRGGRPAETETEKEAREERRRTTNEELDRLLKGGRSA
jgi:hypothetical protein